MPACLMDMLRSQDFRLKVIGQIRCNNGGSSMGYPVQKRRIHNMLFFLYNFSMNLPYGTMKDKEMKALRVDILQDEGIFYKHI
jgi:hypothetical protein